MNYKKQCSRVLGFGLYFCLICANSTIPAQQNSVLWGSNGERWDALGRLPDYSYAGYHSGEADIPDVAVVVNVSDFGAIPNDDQDDSAAIQAAIDAADKGAVLVPPGSYRLETPITIRKSGVVIRGSGDGSGGTLFYVPENATERAGGNHDMRFSWGSAGFIVMFQGNSPTGSTKIVSDAARGDHKIRLSDASDFQAGVEIVVSLQDDGLYGSLFRHLHNNRLSGWSEGSADSWCGASDSWPFTIEAVNGNDITLKEPLPFDIRSEWSPTVQRGRAITESGIENLRIRFRYAAPVMHLTERGFNAIRFERVRDSWVRNVTLEDIDNGITVGKQSSKNSLIDIVVEGRRGHHATTISGGSSYNIISGIKLDVDNSDDEWIHAFTIDHGAQGNVIQLARSNKTLRLDLHRDSPFENLYTEILTKSNFKSGGNKCAGPHTGARLTLWNAADLFEGLDEDLLKGIDSQVNIITRTDRAGTTSKDGLWVENIENVQPKNLYQAQLARRLGNNAPTPSVSVVSTTVKEADGIVEVAARLSERSSREVNISVHTKRSTAINGEDFYGLSQTFTIPAGALETSIPVTIINDRTRESDEKFELKVFAVEGADIGNATAVVSITDDDDVTVPDLSIEDGRVIEGDSYAVRLTLSQPASTVVGASIATQADSAINGQDYYGFYETVEFAVGETEKLVPMSILDDTETESDETFKLTIFSVKDAGIKRRQSSTVIVDND